MRSGASLIALLSSLACHAAGQSRPQQPLGLAHCPDLANLTPGESVPFAIAPDALDALTRAQSALRLEIASAHTPLTLQLQPSGVTASGRHIWLGEVAGVAGSQVTLVAGHDLAAAVIRAGALGLFEIRPADGGRHVLLRASASDGEQCAVTEALRFQRADAPTATSPRPAATAHPPAPLASLTCDDGSTLDLLVVYTAQARAGAGGTAAIHTLIDLAVADTNAALTRSAVDLQVQLVHRQEVTYAETGNWTIDAPRLVDPDDGFLDDVHPLRDQYGADCISLWVESLNASGVAFFPDGSLTGINASGINMIRRNDPGVLKHELGHNFGVTHDRASQHDVPLRPYGYGYVEPGGAWQDIMAVQPTAYIPYYANPNVNWPGPTPGNPGPTGVAEGFPNPSDVARAMNDLRLVVTNFRQTVTPGLPPVLHVRADAAPGGDGLSWATAYNDLNAAICAAAGSGGAVTSLWVKAGTYKPDPAGLDRSASFRLLDGLRIYGGFAGAETSLNQRNPSANITRLSGDIGTPGVDTDNSYHVIDATGAGPTAVLDGVTISDGYADGAEPDDAGGGLLLDGAGSPTLIGCIIEQNAAVRGGGLYVSFDAAPALIACTIRDNVAFAGDWPGGGGGLYCGSGAAPLLIDCDIRDNAAPRGAGVACFFDCLPVLQGCRIEGNETDALGEGGGFYGYTRCSPDLTDCLVAGNRARFGSGMANLFECSPALLRCRFEANACFAEGEGGALNNYSFSSPSIDRCDFIANSAQHGGAILNAFGAAPHIRNTRFLANTASGDGGALNNFSDAAALLEGCHFAGNSAANGGAAITFFNSDVQLRSCTLVRNTATFAAGGIYNFDSDVTLANSLLWDNRVGAVADQNAQLFVASGSATLRHSSLQGWTGSLGGVNNNGSNPTFRDADGSDNAYGTEDDDVQLASGSSAINSGTNADIAVDFLHDLAGRPRIWNTTVDRGAHERAPGLGDLDTDDDVDATDAIAFYECQRGPDLTPAPVPPPTVAECLAAFDFDLDGDVDQADAAGMQAAFDP